ncbi:MAG: hypothetical protein A4S14_08150 [Proteobacteria bacterium SG_bin9]|nr:MAG: hypothetical protein A4S14_08150 [Proteobacteria bacterium SG_bin9]
MKLVLLPLIVCAALVTHDDANAAAGDTNIYVHYKVNAVRVRPSARVGSATVDFRIVLRANGTVSDAFAVKDGLKGTAKVKLGRQPKGVVYRVIDDSTIERTFDVGAHIHKLTVKVAGKNCTATSDYILKPGEKEFRDYSTELKQMAYFSSLKAEYVTCVIE